MLWQTYLSPVRSVKRGSVKMRDASLFTHTRRAQQWFSVRRGGCPVASANADGGDCLGKFSKKSNCTQVQRSDDELRCIFTARPTFYRTQHKQLIIRRWNGS